MRVSVMRSAVVSTVMAVAAGALAPASAQLGISRSDQSVLVLWPVPAANIRNNPADSTLAIQIGDLFREKLDVKERFKMRVPARARICEVLMGSGFRCPELLDAENADRLADAMKPDAYIVGTITRNSRPTLHLRMVDLKKTGISGWLTIVGDTNWKAEQFAQAAVDSVDASLRGAEGAHECYDKLDHNDVKGAREKVNEIFKYAPQQPAAAMCLVRVFDTQHAKVDSIIFALEKAVRGDSLNSRAWDRLANAYEEKGDHPKSVEARAQQLVASPRNTVLRRAVAAGLIELKQYQKGVDIIDVGLQDNPLDAQLLNMKQRACLEASMWKCALSALAAFYDADTTLRNDSVFFAKTFGAAQSLSDTAAMLKWSAEAVKRIPNSLTMWRARAAALNTAGKTDSAVLAYQRILQYDSTNVGAMLIVAKSMVDGLQIDSATAVDTVKLGQINTYLGRASALAKDSAAAQGTIGTLYALPGLLMASKRKDAALYVPWLEKGVKFPLQPRIMQQANFFLSIAYLNDAVAVDPQIQAMGHPTPARALTAQENARACVMVSQEEVAAMKSKDAMVAGQLTSPPTATRVLAAANQFLTKNIPQYKKFFKCTN